MFIRTSIMHNNLFLSRTPPLCVYVYKTNIVVNIVDTRVKKEAKNTAEQMKCMRNTCS